MGIISGSVSFRGRFGDHFSVGDHFGVGIINFRELYSAMTSNPKSLRTTGNEAAKVSVPATVPAFSNLRLGVILFYFFLLLWLEKEKKHKGIIGRGLGERA